LTCIHEHETACAVGVLRHTNVVTCLSKGGSLLVSCVTRHLNRPSKELWVGFPIDSAGWHHLRQHSSRDAQFLKNDVIPLTLIDVVHEGTRGIGGIGDVD